MATILVFVPLAYVGFLFFIARHYWKRFKREGVSKTFNFRITDIWAAMVGLVPTLVLASFLLENTQHRGLQSGDIVAIAMSLLLVGGAQIVGLLIGRIHIELPPHRGANTAGESAISIVTGALIGLAFPVIFAVGSAMFFSSAFFPVVVVAVFVVALYRRRKQ